MKLSDLVVEVRDSTLARVGQITPVDLVGSVFISRFNGIGSWSVSLAANSPMADYLRQPGYGIIVSTSNGTIISGPTTSAKLEQTTDDLEGNWLIEGVDDSVLLVERLAYPNPSSSLMPDQAGYDSRLGIAETVIKAYVDANIGPSSPAARQVDSLTVATDLARGSSVSANANFETLQELIYPMAQTGGIGYNIEQVGNGLVFDVYVPTDRSDSIRLDLQNNKLSRTDYNYQHPTATRVIVGGSGSGTGRILLEQTSTESLESETTWGRRIEKFIDDRSNSDTIALEQAGNEVLVDNGKTIVSTAVVPSDDLDMAYDVDWFLGDRVGVVINGIETNAVVTEVGISIEDDGVRIAATVGTPVATDFETKLVENQENANTRISNLERNLTASATQVKQVVNNRTGSTLLKGQAVYISGAQGNRVTVALAEADSEVTSSKTFGLVEADIADNQSGYVITEGSIQGLDTSAFAEGAAVYLSPTVAGGLTTTKPKAPDHLVSVGFVERSQSSNGSIFVRVQNGFEPDELHGQIAEWLLSGYFYAPRSTGTPAAVATTLNTAYAVPFIVPNSVTVNKIGINVTTATTGSTIRLGIYQANSSGLPGNLMLDAGTVLGTTIGIKEVAVSQFLPAGVYYLTAAPQGTAAAPVTQTVGPLFAAPSTTNAVATSADSAKAWSATVSAAFPSTFPTPTATTIYPRVYIGIA